MNGLMSGFDNILGHEDMIMRLQRSIENRKVSHAYIFEGEKGMGKKTLANAFAKALQCEYDHDHRYDHGYDHDHECEHKNEYKGDYESVHANKRSVHANKHANKPCDCLSCRVFDSGNHPDILYVTAEKTKSIAVDDVREQMIRPMHIKPFRYRYKIFIVDAAETLTVAAQNALLKTIEEPAPYGICLLLTTHANALLPTVRSRCVTYRLKPQPDALVRQKLAEVGVAAEAARYATAFARGNIGYALEMAQSEDFHAMRTLAEDVTQRVRQGDLLATFALYHRFEKWKESIQTLLDMLYLCYRDEIVTGVKTRDRRQLSALESVTAITRTKRILRQNGNFQMAIEWLLLHLNGAA